MKTNVGRFDQVLRFSISIVFIYIGFIDQSFITDPLSSAILGIVGIINLIVSLSRFCPLYTLVEIDTCHKKEQ